MILFKELPKRSIAVMQFQIKLHFVQAQLAAKTPIVLSKSFCHFAGYLQHDPPDAVLGCISKMAQLFFLKLGM